MKPPSFNQSFAFWSPVEQIALLRILEDIYQADGEFSEEEMADFRVKLSISSVEAEQIEAEQLDHAVQVIQEHPEKEEVFFGMIAAAVYRDGRFAKEEQRYLVELVRKYSLNAEKLAEHLVLQAQQQET